MTKEELCDVMGKCYYVPHDGFYMVMDVMEDSVWIQWVADCDGEYGEKENCTGLFDDYEDMTAEDFIDYEDVPYYNE